MSRYDDIENLLNTAGGAAPAGYRVRVVKNADRSIDGELLFDIPHGVSVKDAIIDLEQALRDNPLYNPATGRVIPNTWISTAFRFEDSDANPTKRSYNRFQGLNQAATNYYKNVADSVAVAEKFETGMRRKRYRKPTQGLIRIHWNAVNTRPDRLEGVSKVKK